MTVLEDIQQTSSINQRHQIWRWWCAKCLVGTLTELTCISPNTLTWNTCYKCLPLVDRHVVSHHFGLCPDGSMWVRTSLNSCPGHPSGRSLNPFDVDIYCPYWQLVNLHPTPFCYGTHCVMFGSPIDSCPLWTNSHATTMEYPGTMCANFGELSAISCWTKCLRTFQSLTLFATMSIFLNISMQH